VALNKSIELNPTYFAFANLGSLYYYEGRYAEAASMFEKGLQKNSENYLVWEWLMNCYKWLGQKEKAAAALEKAYALATREAELKPRDAMAQAVMATLSAEKKTSGKSARAPANFPDSFAGGSRYPRRRRGNLRASGRSVPGHRVRRKSLAEGLCAAAHEK
jgi:tetratricopeptide (TPR) repeat protein